MARILAFLAIILWGTLLSPYPTAVFIAAVTAALTLPVYRWLRARMRKTAAVSCFSLGLVGCLATPITIVTVMVVPQAMEGASRVAGWWQAGHPIPDSIAYYLREAQIFLIKYVPEAALYINKFQDNLTSIGDSIVRKVLSSGIGLAGDTMNMVWALCLYAVFTCHIVVYVPAIRRLILLGEGILRVHKEQVAVPVRRVHIFLISGEIRFEFHGDLRCHERDVLVRVGDGGKGRDGLQKEGERNGRAVLPFGEPGDGNGAILRRYFYTRQVFLKERKGKEVPVAVQKRRCFQADALSVDQGIGAVRIKDGLFQRGFPVVSGE